MEVAGAFALQEIFEASHCHMERVNDIEAQLCRRFYDVTVVLHQPPLLVLLTTRTACLRATRFNHVLTRSNSNLC